jgi:hypothetical protein
MRETQYLSGELLKHVVGVDLIARVMRLAPIGRSDPNYRTDQPMRGYISGELLKHMVGVDLIALVMRACSYWSIRP